MSRLKQLQSLKSLVQAALNPDYGYALRVFILASGAESLDFPDSELPAGGVDNPWATEGPSCRDIMIAWPQAWVQNEDLVDQLIRPYLLAIGPSEEQLLDDGEGGWNRWIEAIDRLCGALDTPLADSLIPAASHRHTGTALNELRMLARRCRQPIRTLADLGLLTTASNVRALLLALSSTIEVETGRALVESIAVNDRPPLDPNDYVSATEILNRWDKAAKIVTAKHLNDILTKRVDRIRSANIDKNGTPHPRRRMVHLGDWRAYYLSEYGLEADTGEAPGAQPTLKEIEAGTRLIRQEKGREIGLL